MIYTRVLNRGLPAGTDIWWIIERVFRSGYTYAFSQSTTMERCSVRITSRPTRSEVTNTVDDYTTDELQEALRPIASLISKSEKAQQKLSPGTWQHTMLRDNLSALHIGSALLNKVTDHRDHFTRECLRRALPAFALMISKTEEAQAKFSPGTSQHTLQRNRLKALRIAEAVIKAELDRG